MHVLLGTLAVAGILGALSTRKGSLWHRRFGNFAVTALALSLSVAIVVALAKSNLFLLMIAAFSAYLMFSGRRIARAHQRVITPVDRGVFLVTLLLAAAMILYAARLAVAGSPTAWPLMLFGAIALILAAADWRRGTQWPDNPDRIALHATRMGATAIAVITAVLVVNVSLEPAWLPWVLPSVVLAPLNAWIAHRIKNPPD